jgi:predicted HicB family RNase H-like nuclease
VKQRGRPRGRTFDGQVSVRLNAAQHDELCREALRRGVTLARVVRERISAPQKTQGPQNTAH